MKEYACWGSTVFPVGPPNIWTYPDTGYPAWMKDCPRVWAATSDEAVLELHVLRVKKEVKEYIMEIAK